MSESDDEVEVLDVTTPSPAPRSRTTTAATAAGTGASSPTSRQSGVGGGAVGRGGRTDPGEGSDSSRRSSDDDEYGVSLMKRLQARRAPASATSGATGSRPTASGAASGSRPGTGAAARDARRVTAVIDSSSDEEEELDSDGFKGKGKAKRPEAASRAGSGSGGGGDAAAGNNSSRDDGDEEEDYMAGTQENQVVEVVISDDEGGAAPGRSRLWNNDRAGGPSDDDEEEEAAGTSMTPSDLDLDGLLLASQASSASVPSSSRGGGAASSRGAGAGAGAGARAARGNTSGERGGGRGGVNDSDAAATGVAEDSDDEFSLDFGGGGGGGRGKGASSSSTSRKVPASGGGGAAAAAAAVGAAASSSQDKATKKKRPRDEERAAAREQKEQERRDKTQRNQAEKAVRAQKKLADAAEKAETRKKQEQARGNFKSQEIACVMERRFFDNPRNARARAGAVEQPTGKADERFKVAAGDCDVAGAVWWTRRDYLAGGAAVSGRGVQTLDILVVVVPPDKFLGLLVPAGSAGRAAADGNVFPDLGRFVDGIRRAADGFSRLVLVLEGVKEELDRQWAASAKSGGKGSTGGRCTKDGFEDAQCWLLIHKDVETRLTKDGEETGQYLWDLTRALAGLPYDDEVTELHCVPRSKVEARGSDLVGAEEKKLMDTWVKMLTQVQDVSEGRAVEIATYYPLPRDLVAALSDPAVPEPERIGLLQRKMGTGKNQKSASKRIFELFTQEDGDFVID